MGTGFKNCTFVKDIGVTLQCCKIQGWRERYSIDYNFFFDFAEYEKIMLSIRVGLGRTMTRKTDFQVNFDTNPSIAMHVIAQFEAVYIPISDNPVFANLYLDNGLPYAYSVFTFPCGILSSLSYIKITLIGLENSSDYKKIHHFYPITFGDTQTSLAHRDMTS